MGINEIYNLNHVQSFGAGHAARQRAKEEIQGFEGLIQEKAGDRLSFLKHAVKCLGEGGIAADNQLLGDLEHAADEARKKGSRDVAVIGSQDMFIVDTPNNTMVTTTSQDDMKNRIFTDIDSAISVWAGPDRGPASCLERVGRNSRKESVC